MTEMDSANPYASPSAAGRPVKYRARSVGEGPLLSLSVTSLIFACMASPVTVVPDQRWIQNGLVFLSVCVGIISLGVSFYLHRQARAGP